MSKSKDTDWALKKKHAERAEKKKKLSKVIEDEHNDIFKNQINWEDKDEMEYKDES